jgi:hypothetical protein
MLQAEPILGEEAMSPPVRRAVLAGTTRIAAPGGTVLVLMVEVGGS